MEEEEDPFVRPRNQRPHQRRRNPLTMQELENLLAPQTDPSRVLLLLDREDSGFDLLLQTQLLQVDRVKATVRVLAKAFGIIGNTDKDRGTARQNRNQAQRQAVINVINKFLNSETFRDKVRAALSRTPGTDETFVRAVLGIAKLALQTSPALAANSLYTLVLNLEDVVFHNNNFIQQHVEIPHLVEEMVEVQELLRRGARMPSAFGVEEGDEENALRQQRRLRHREDDMDPSEFRELSIIPSEDDFDPAKDIEVRANKVVGGYDNVDQYLDIQFRLLRADLLLPLRESVMAYIGGSQEGSHTKGICTYSEVRIVRPICSDKGLCFRLSFDVSRTRRVNWAASQRLKYGSLLCLSADNFTTYHCAVVENRDVKDLEFGLVDVQFLATQDVAVGNVARAAPAAVEDSIALLKQARDQRFTMVESPAYFEAYKHVLTALQNVTVDTFPFWQYIGECLPQAESPRYLRDAGQVVRYDLRPLVDNDYKIKDRPDNQVAAADDNDQGNGGFTIHAEVARDIDILRREEWPNANTLELDVSQFNALQTALTQEFSIIQGPPGTGKTFLGLKVMKVLLHNRHIWANGGNNDGRLSPILLVCYTNHALDQFLESMLDFFQGNLVRVGSRSKSEKLEEYNLRDIRKRAQENRTVPIEIHLAKRQVRLDMKDLKATIHKEAAKLEILEREIVKASFLKNFMSPDHWNQLSAKKSNNKHSPILNWLKIAHTIDKIEAMKEDQTIRAEKLVCKRVTVSTAEQQQGAEAIPNGEAVDGVIENVHNDAESEEEEDEDQFFEVVTADSANRFLDVDDEDEDSDDEEDDLFAELQDGLMQDYIDRRRNVNQRLDDVDREAELLRSREVAFNISNYGEEDNHEGNARNEFNRSEQRSQSTEQEKQQRALLKLVKQQKQKYKLKLLEWLQNTGEKMTEEEALAVQNIWHLRLRERWRLYRFWVDIQCRQLRGEIRDTAHQYEEKARRYQEILHQEDKAILEKSTVIGMTTTGAAKYQAVLSEIGPKVVIVEEAAEVLEGHVMTSISERCQHVVLIGDHKQLRPNPAVHRLKSECGLDISLFERLINNGFRFNCLRYQHRMRPEISQLLKVPALYPDLQDHDKVKVYPHVCNISQDVCLLQHEEHDQQEIDTSTFTNLHEARMLVGLCEYLLLQGYSPKDITILTPYKGQVQLIKTQLKALVRSKSVADRMEKGGLKISSVDNYQGEENNIILLSLVRSNPDNDVGFLKANNRLCVALSRAKIGLYVVGNLAGIAEKSVLMRDVLHVARRQGLFKNHLTLSCPRHRAAATIIQRPDDFKNIPDGGCKQPCQVRLDCGHACKRICHPDDPKHIEAATVCDEPCAKLCQVCDQRCKGGHRCGKHKKCDNLVQKRVPMCGHLQNVPCHMPAEHFECVQKCDERLPCGHLCQASCGTRHDHTKVGCSKLVQVTPSLCDHGEYSISCEDVHQGGNETADLRCPEPCKTILGCGHLCSGSCGQCLKGRLHRDCQYDCQKILICGHSCQAKCGSCPPCSLPCETACSHSNCNKLCGEPCQPCLETCDWKCPHATCEDLCCQPCERSICDEPCPKRLPCGCRCCGLCGETCPKLCSRCDVEKLKSESLYGFDGDRGTRFVQLDCGHVLEAEFVDQWMITDLAQREEEGSEQGGGQTVTIGLKTCPLCKTPIRKCQRYNNAIKTQLRLIERVKRKSLGERKGQLEQQLKAEIDGLGVAERRDVQKFIDLGPEFLSETILEAQLRQVVLFQQIRALRRVTCELRARYPNLLHAMHYDKTSFQQIDHALGCFEQWTLQVRAVFTEQNQQDSSLEISRLRLLLNLLKVEAFLPNSGQQGGSDLTINQRQRMNEAIRHLTQQGQVEQNIVDQCETLVEELSKLTPSRRIVITAEEKKAIVAAVGVTQGAWYQCPNGHVYAIGECGQAMQESKCPDCQARIGGTNHQLASGNTVALDMDGADRPVWDNLEADRQLAERLQRELNDIF